MLFRQSRIGENGRPFALYKFRTMPPPSPDAPGTGRGLPLLGQ